jgi:hypothetical protein
MKTLPQVHDWRKSKIDRAALRDGPEVMGPPQGERKNLLTTNNPGPARPEEPPVRGGVSKDERR